MLAVVLALGTSVSYGVANFLGSLLSRRLPLAAVLLISQTAALAATALYVLGSGDGPPSGRGLAFGLLAGTGNLVGLSSFYRGAMLAPVSIVAAIGALGTAVPVLVDLGRGEHLEPLQALGIVLAVAGAVLAAAGRGTGEGAAVDPRGLWWAMLSALGFGGFLTALPEASAEGTPWALLDARTMVVVLLIIGATALRAPVRVSPRAAAPAAVPGLLLLAGTLAYAEAAARGRLSVVAVLASLATVVTVGLGYVVVHERLRPAQGLGVALAVVGTVMVAA